MQQAYRIIFQHLFSIFNFISKLKTINVWVKRNFKKQVTAPIICDINMKVEEGGERKGEKERRRKKRGKLKQKK